ncbi:piggyBac transposable element-derived protein 3-like [Pararge aegeria]|uniref:piggyBac transposable element-derived protein 3-like n=1 Tax=Pararge aegeria TaxID=116150 RepID=UPI0019D24A3E|nr:piggyBac transposable element-derived protein 3-like [Pararge aegeria]
MPAYFVERSGQRTELTGELLLQLIGDGNDSEIEEVEDDEGDQEESVLQLVSAEEPESPPRPGPSSATATKARQKPTKSRDTRRRIWKQMPFNQKEHSYPERSSAAVRSPLAYFEDYFDDKFFEHAAVCTNNYYMRKTGKVLNTTAAELKKFVGIHFIMGCIPYPRIHMYWRIEMRLALVADKISRDRFKILRMAFHVVDSDDAPAGNQNSLWKVQPVLTQVKNACDKLERQPGFYSIDEQMIPFSGTCPRGLRQVIKTKPRPQGLKAFVATTYDGLMIDFEVYQGAKTNFGDKSLGVGASVILHLSKSIPRGSCLYFDRFFSSIPLLERLNELGLHGTGTIMMNRVPERKNMDFKLDRKMKRGESQQFVSNDVVVVKWMDNKSVLVASNCTSGDDSCLIKRWDKNLSAFTDVSCPKVIANYNKNMGGVDILDQSIEYYRTFIKTKKWTLKVILHFFDLAISNAWRLYVLNSITTRVPKSKIMDLLEFRMQVSDGLVNAPERKRRSDTDEQDENQAPNTSKFRRPNPPSVAKRYDGYDHLPSFDQIDSPRACRMEGCKRIRPERDKDKSLIAAVRKGDKRIPLTVLSVLFENA